MIDKKALLVIDMQKGSFVPETPRFDTEGVVKKINKLAEKFRREGHSVIFIQHDGTDSGEFEKHNWDWELLEELEAEDSDLLIDKYANDCFYNSGLESKLNELSIQELVITGCATDFCVESTIQSALSKDYFITVVSNAHTTADRPNLSAKQVIDHYNWVWENMILTKGRIIVKSAESILSGPL